MLLVFTLGDERFALSAMTVQRVVRAVTVAALPGAPSIVEGVVNVAGTLVPVLDLRTRFNLPAAPLTPDQHLIIATAGPRTVALRVDRAAEVREVAPDDIDTGPRFGAESDYVAGVARLTDGVLVISDLARFLAKGESARLDVALPESPA